MLAGEGMSQVVRGLVELVAQKTYYSGDLLFSVEILRNVTDTYKRATYIPSSDDVQVPCQDCGGMVLLLKVHGAPGCTSVLAADYFVLQSGRV